MIKVAYKLRLLIVLSVFWTLLGLMFAYISYSVASGVNSANPWSNFSLNLLKFYLWFAFVPLIFQAVKRFGFERGETFFVNFFIHVSISFVLAGIQTNIYILLVSLIADFRFVSSPDALVFTTDSSVTTPLYRYFFFGNFFLNVLLYAMIVIIIQAYLLYTKYLAEETRSSQLKAELADAQLQALKMQLQPHFLFNTLHSISSLNLVDPIKANQMIARLGKFLRMTLENFEEQMVTLNQEIEFLRSYLEIEQIRFSDRLQVRFEIEAETFKAEVPHLILQPAVENAVKYGIAPFAAPGEIVISAKKLRDRLRLNVADGCEKTNKDVAAANASSCGKGLSNIRSRLEHLYSKNFRFEMLPNANGGMTVELEIPFAVKSDPETSNVYEQNVA